MPRPLLQLALDTYDLPSALAPLQRAAPHIDIIEAGTILCLAEGMQAVRVISSLFPDKVILADVRIAEAGSIIAKMAFEAGANWVSVVSGAAPSTAEVVYAVAQEYAGDVQIELSEGWSWEEARRWRAIGISQAIVHRSRDAEAQGNLSWGERDLNTINQLAEMGYRVTVAGSVGIEDIAMFAGVPVHVIVCGRAIRDARDPAQAAQAFQDAIARHFGGNSRGA